MASLVKKMIRGKPYYYARECKRINGKPKIVWQKYLGRAEDIIAVLTTGPAAADPPQPREAMVTDFGAVVAVYDLAARLRLVECIDRHVAKRGTGPSVGEYLLVAALNRCVAPCSKAGIAEWFQSTALRRLIPIKARQLTSQRFWDNMDRVSSQAIVAIEQDLTATRCIDAEERIHARLETPGPEPVATVFMPGLVDIEHVLLCQGLQ